MPATCSGWFDRPSIFGMQGLVDRGWPLKHPNMRNTVTMLGNIVMGSYMGLWRVWIRFRYPGGREDQFGEKVHPVTLTRAN